MSDTTFTNGVTLTDADWFNDVNRLHYTIFADAADVTAAKVAIKAHPWGHIGGLTYANGDGAGGGDQTNDITIAAGEAVDSTRVRLLSLPSAITKQLDAAWAVGTGAGGLDTGSIGNSDYYIWLITRIDTGVVDVLFSLSSTAPTMPTNYTLKRLIGWFKRVGAAIVLFHTYEMAGGGVLQLWDAPTLDADVSNTLTQAKRSDLVKVPSNLSTMAIVNAEAYDASVPGTAWVFCPDQTGGTDPAVATAPLASLHWLTSYEAVSQLEIMTDATGKVAARGSLTTVDNYRLATLGFKWARRN